MTANGFNGNRLLSATGVTTIAAGVFAVAYFNPVSAGFFPACPFHALTGLNCPGCGLTRGFHALFHGDIPGALRFNLLIPFFSLFFGFLTISMFLYAVRGRGLPFRIIPNWTIYTFLIFALVFAVVRNLPFYPFNLLII